MKRNIRLSVLALAAWATALCTACSSTEYLVENPNVVITYKLDPSDANLENLSKSYAATIAKNRKAGIEQPGLYCDYASTLALMGKTTEAEQWFNKEISAFPSSRPYVQRVKAQMAQQQAAKAGGPRRTPTIDEVKTMDDIGIMRPTENRVASELPIEQQRQALQKDEEGKPSSIKADGAKDKKATAKSKNGKKKGHAKSKSSKKKKSSKSKVKKANAANNKVAKQSASPRTEAQSDSTATKRKLRLPFGKKKTAADNE
ncbi:MAG: DUF4810 domain-containing protein [Bacteroidales bacterium]|nr:DUF4810 domain-containing protein [Bacteroidales bacterium]